MFATPYKRGIKSGAKRIWPSVLSVAHVTALTVAGCKDSVTPSSMDRPASTAGDAAFKQVAFTAEVCGPIVATLVITENTRRICDNGNHVRRNHFHGNGSVAVGPPLGTPNDFGVGLVGTSRDNVIEENSIGGNINGILLYPLTTGNLIRRNLIAGNPPVQVSVTAGSPVGADIRDASPPGANTFIENHCITYEGATTPPPCPNFPRARGHY